MIVSIVINVILASALVVSCARNQSKEMRLKKIIINQKRLLKKACDLNEIHIVNDKDNIKFGGF